MRRRLHALIAAALAALLLVSVEPYLVVVRAAYSRILDESAGSTDGNSTTTTGVSSSGADLCVAAISSFASTTIAAISDSQSNTWTPLTTQTSALTHLRFLYVASPTTNASHTFTATQSGSFPAIAVLCYSGADTTPFDTENGAVDNVNSPAIIQPGSVGGSIANQLFLTAVAFLGTADSISGFGANTIVENVASAGGQHFGVAVAEEIQTTATARNPTWAYTPAGNGVSAVIAAFDSSGGGGAVPCRRSLVGVGCDVLH